MSQLAIASASILILFFTSFTPLAVQNADAALTSRLFSDSSPLLAPSQLRQSGDERESLTFEQCELLGCESPRYCRLIAEPDMICTGAGRCHCLPTTLQTCSSHIHCVVGEVCAEVDGFGTVCAAESVVDELPGAKRLPGEKPSPPPFPSGKGLTFDPCNLLTCESPRYCVTIVDEEETCPGDLACHCVPTSLISCSSSRECVDGEVCTTVTDRGTICVSESFATHSSLASSGSSGGGTPPSSAASTSPASTGSSGGSEAPPPETPPSSGGGPSGISPPTSSESSAASSNTDQANDEQIQPTQSSGPVLFGSVCIAVQSLQHLPRQTLRFNVDSTALVLCDENGSCATPGHMVRRNGQPMMMISYCKHAACKRRLLKVNSPRYRRGMTIPSRTSGLVFTVFAARYGTFAEEKVLKVALRLGL